MICMNVTALFDKMKKTKRVYIKQRFIDAIIHFDDLASHKASLCLMTEQ